MGVRNVRVFTVRRGMGKGEEGERGKLGRGLSERGERAWWEVRGEEAGLGQDDQGYPVVREEAREDTHAVPTVRSVGVALPEEGVRGVRVPCGAQAQLQLGPQGHPAQDHGDGPHALHEEPAPARKERVPRGRGLPEEAVSASSGLNWSGRT